MSLSAFCSLAVPAPCSAQFPFRRQHYCCSLGPEQPAVARRRRFRGVPRTSRQEQASPAVDAGPAQSAQALLNDAAASARLRSLLRATSFLARVARLGGCDFVQFSGVVFELPGLSDACPDGVPDAFRAYAEDVAFCVVNVPPGIVARALAGTRRAADVPKEYAKALASADELPRLGAVYLRRGLAGDEIAIEEEAAVKGRIELDAQLKAWSDWSASGGGRQQFEEDHMEQLKSM